jgi:predicted nucleic acid-binding protein
VTQTPIAGGPILLDTTVYVDVLRGKTPAALDLLIQSSINYHSSVAVSELMHAFGRLDPAHPDTKPALALIADIIENDIPEHRLFAPDVETFAAAGAMAGLMCRVRNYARNQGLERKALNDALIYLQARKLGAAVLTRNVSDFDLLNQIEPSGRILLYA